MRKSICDMSGPEALADILDWAKQFPEDGHTPAIALTPTDRKAIRSLLDENEALRRVAKAALHLAEFLGNGIDDKENYSRAGLAAELEAVCVAAIRVPDALRASLRAELESEGKG